MAPTYSQHADPTPEQLAAFMATHPPIAGAESQPGAPPAAAEGGGGQGEGAASQDDGLYDLESVPAELREQFVPHLKAIEGNVTKKFQEAAEYRKGWEPYEELGVRDVEPETMEQVLNWLEMTSDPEQYKAWVQSQAQSLGLTAEQAAAASNDATDEYGSFEDSEGEYLTPQQAQEMVQAELQKFQQSQKAEQELTAAQQQTERELEARFDSLSKELGLAELPEAARTKHENTIWAIAQAQYSGDKDPVGKAFADYKAMIGQTETDLLRRKLAAPSPPEGGGGAPDTAVERPKTFAQAADLMRERLRANAAA